MRIWIIAKDLLKIHVSWLWPEKRLMVLGYGDDEQKSAKHFFCCSILVNLCSNKDQTYICILGFTFARSSRSCQEHCYEYSRRRITWLILVILYLYSDRTGKKIVQYFLNTQRISMWYNERTMSSYAANEYWSVLCYALYFSTRPRAKTFSLCSRLCGKIQRP